MSTNMKKLFVMAAIAATAGIGKMSGQSTDHKKSVEKDSISLKDATPAPMRSDQKMMELRLNDARQATNAQPNVSDILSQNKRDADIDQNSYQNDPTFFKKMKSQLGNWMEMSSIGRDKGGDYNPESPTLESYLVEMENVKEVHKNNSANLDFLVKQDAFIYDCISDGAKTVGDVYTKLLEQPKPSVNHAPKN